MLGYGAEREQAGEGMGWLAYPYRVGHIAGIQIRVWRLLAIILVIMMARSLWAWTTDRISGLDMLLYSFLPIIVVIGSVLWHELGHCYGNFIVGSRSRFIDLTPLGGLADSQGGAASPRAELLVVGLGPLASFVLGFAAYGVFKLFTALISVDPINTSLGHHGAMALSQLLYYTMVVNLVLGLFNLLPLFPLDGGRLARALLSLRMNPNKATYYVTTGAIGVAVTLSLLELTTEALSTLVRRDLDVIFLLIMVGCVISSHQERIRIRYENAYTGGLQLGESYIYSSADEHWRWPRWIQRWKGGLRGGPRETVIRSAYPPRPARDQAAPRDPRRSNSAKIIAMGSPRESTSSATAIADPPEAPLTGSQAKWRRLRELDGRLKDLVRREEFAEAATLKREIESLRRELGDRD